MPQNLSRKAWLAVAREATPGVAAAAPTLYVPQKSVLKGTRKREYINDERNTRDGNNDVVDLTQEGSVDPKGAWYNDSSVYMLIAALGAVASAQPDATNAPTAYKHTITPADQPPSLTFFKGYGNQVYQMSFGVIEKFAFKWTPEKVLEFDSDAKGNFPIPYTGAALTPAYSTVKPFSGVLPTITLGGTSSSDIDDLSISFDQKVTLWYAAGSPDYIAAYYGERTVKVDFTARFDSTTIFDRFRNKTDDSLVFDVQGPIIGGSIHQELNISVPVIGYDDVVHDLSKDNVLIKAKATARPSAGQSLISAWVQNTITSYTI